MFFNFMRRKGGNGFVVFKSLSVRLFQIRGPCDDIQKLVTLNKIFGSLKLYSVYLEE